ncbi:MAG: DUF2493 domain-containing protein [Proteobacteria bacterium]|nr:MAG: DUF2493 domain-containing protein [Pseudomonadota bacterium]
MKLIIAGGRDYRFTSKDIEQLNRLENITEVVSGGAQGADNEGEQWATEQGIPIKIFKADWKKYGRGAGPKRNQAMADYADALALFPGGKGTDNMYQQAQKAGLVVYDWRL